MKTLTTNTERIIKVGSNQKKRTFTIVTESGRYRTLPFSKEEFTSADRNWTGNDWQQFLRTDEYYKV